MNWESSPMIELLKSKFEVGHFTSTLEVALWEHCYRQESADLYKMRFRLAKSIFNTECQDPFSMSEFEIHKWKKRLAFLYSDLETVHKALVFMEEMRFCYYRSTIRLGECNDLKAISHLGSSMQKIQTDELV